MKYDVKTEVQGTDIAQEVFASINGVHEQMMRRVLRTTETQTREALIALGWTPPPEGEEAKTLRSFKEVQKATPIPLRLEKDEGKAGRVRRLAGAGSGCSVGKNDTARVYVALDKAGKVRYVSYEAVGG